MTYYSPPPIAEYPRDRVRTGGALIVADIIAIIGVVVGCVSLFVHGWINAKVAFLPTGRSGAQILQQFGVDVDRELTRIANREISGTISPTLWQYNGHAFQLFFALLVLTGMLLLIGLAAPRVRILVHVLALLASAGAVSVMVLTFLHVRDQMDSLPARVAQAVVTSPLANRIFAVTTGKPTVDAKPGWPLYAAVAGVALALLGSLFALLFAATRPSRR